MILQRSEKTYRKLDKKLSFEIQPRQLRSSFQTKKLQTCVSSEERSHERGALVIRLGKLRHWGSITSKSGTTLVFMLKLRKSMFGHEPELVPLGEIKGRSKETTGDAGASPQ